MTSTQTATRTTARSTESSPKFGGSGGLAEKTLCIKVRLGRLGNRRKVSSSQIEVDADKDSIRVSKSLLESKELEAIRSLDGEIRRYLYSKCLPYYVEMHFLPIEFVEDVTERLKKFAAEREKLIDKFIEAYPRLCEQAIERLRGLYNPDDYPPAEYARQQFHFSWQYKSLGEVPEKLRAISPKLFREERDKVASMVSEAATEIKALMRESFAELVEHLRDRLTDVDGKPKVLRESAVQNLRDFLFNFDFKNVENDQELKTQVERVREMLDGANVDQLRNVDSLRERVRDGMAKVSEKLDTMIVARGRRIREDEE